MNNKQLFYYRVKSNLIKYLGMFVIFLSVIGFLTHWLLGLVIFIIGAYFIVKSQEWRFDYQRQSGSIVHAGDNW